MVGWWTAGAIQRRALAWVYGDVVHYDADRRAGAPVFGARERYRTAVLDLVQAVPPGIC
jgi:hypothetical protein